MYHIMCGLLQLYFYTCRRDEPEKWKCQPHRFLTRSNELHEMVVGTINMMLASAMSGFLACWIVTEWQIYIAQSISEWMNTDMSTSSSPLCWCFCTWMLGHTTLTICCTLCARLYKNVRKHHHR